MSQNLKRFPTEWHKNQLCRFFEWIYISFQLCKIFYESSTILFKNQMTIGQSPNNIQNIIFLSDQFITTILQNMNKTRKDYFCNSTQKNRKRNYFISTKTINIKYCFFLTHEPQMLNLNLSKTVNTVWHRIDFCYLLSMHFN